MAEEQQQKVQMTGPKHVGGQDGDPRSWLQPCPPLAVTTIWKVNQWVEDPSVFNQAFK